MNRLDSLPRGFGAFAVLEVLDLTYNNLNEASLPGNFFMLGNYKILNFNISEVLNIFISINYIFLIFRNTTSIILR